MVLVSNETGEIIDANSITNNHNKFCIIARSEEDIAQIMEMCEWCIPFGYDIANTHYLFSIINRKPYFGVMGFFFYVHAGKWNCFYTHPKDLCDDVPIYNIYIPEDIYEEVSDEELFNFINA